MSQKDEIPKEILKKYGVAGENSHVKYTRYTKRSKKKAVGYSLMGIGGAILCLSIVTINIFLIFVGLIVFFSAMPFFK